MVTDAGFPFHTIATSKKTNKRRERDEKITDEKASPDLIGGEGEKIKQEQKTKSKDPPRISEKQIKDSVAIAIRSLKDKCVTIVSLTKVLM